jgi:hypothetical protein
LLTLLCVSLVSRSFSFSNFFLEFFAATRFLFHSHESVECKLRTQPEYSSAISNNKKFHKPNTAQIQHRLSGCLICCPILAPSIFMLTFVTQTNITSIHNVKTKVTPTTLAQSRAFPAMLQ